MNDNHYHCTVDALDYLQIYTHDEGIHFSIKMYGKEDQNDFGSPAIILTQKEVKRLINELTDLIK